MRHPTAQDMPEVIELARSIKLFESDEEIDELIRKPLEEYLAAAADSADSSKSDSRCNQWWIMSSVSSSQSSGNDSRECIACASFTAPQPDEDGAFNMIFIGVRPEFQKRGIGSTMVRKVEQWVKESHGAERLLVETACTLHGAQAFYKKMGYAERKRIKDLYGEGADAVQFCKHL